MDDRGIVARSLTEARDFSAYVNSPANSAIHPASYSLGLSGSFVVGKAGKRGVKLTPTSDLVPRLIMCGAVPPLVIALMTCIWTSSAVPLCMLERRMWIMNEWPYLRNSR